MTGYLGLGSNEGDRLAALRRARTALSEVPEIEVLASSSAYETAPQGEVTDQRDFLNACVRIATDLAPEELLTACKAIEALMGREAGGVRHGPRPIDVDLLALGDLEYSSPRLTIPHRDIAIRRFVLEPLLELDAGLELPGLGQLAPRLADLRDQPVTAVGPL